MSKSNDDFLYHNNDECIFIKKHTESISEESFFTDELLRKAMIRSLEVIGEATKNIGFEFRESHATVPWKKMSGMRDKLIHHYFGVNEQIVWRTCIEIIPEIHSKIENILKEIKNNQSNK